MEDIIFQTFLALLGIVIGLLSLVVQPRGQKFMLLIFGLLLFLFAGLWLGFRLASGAPLSVQQTAPTLSSPPVVADADCMGTLPGHELRVLHPWSGTDQQKLDSILKRLVDRCGIEIVTNTIALTNDPGQDLAQLDVKIKSFAPDVLFWPNPHAMTQYAGQLYDLNQMGADARQYAVSLRDLGTVDGRWLALPVKLNVKSLVWYSPSRFQALGYRVPTTFEELNTLADEMASRDNTPWSMGLESGEASGWAASDFIQDLLLVQQGPEYVMDLIAGRVPYDDAGVVQAYQTYAKWASDPAYTPGGAIGTINTGFSDALFKVFNEDSEAMMVRQADWARGRIVSQLPHYEYGVDYGFFAFPGVRGLQVGIDNMVVFHDKLATRAFVAYLTSASGAAAWAQADFDVSPNVLAAGNYVDLRLAKEGEIVARATIFTPDLGDQIGGSFSQAEWAALINVLQGADITGELSAVAAAQRASLSP